MWPVLDSPDGTMHAIVCGSRTWADCMTVAHWLEALRQQYPILTIIEGGANGADSCAAAWAEKRRLKGVHWVQIKARWSEYPPETRWRAGHDRNQVMVDMLLAAREGHDHGICTLAFKHELDPRMTTRPDRARGGTEDAITRSWAAGIPVWWGSNEQAPHLLPSPSLPLN